MKRILKIRMDVHITNYTFCAMEPMIGEEDHVFAAIKVTPDYKNILMLLPWLRKHPKCFFATTAKTCP